MNFLKITLFLTIVYIILALSYHYKNHTQCNKVDGIYKVNTSLCFKKEFIHF